MVNRKRTTAPARIGALVVACLAGLILAGCAALSDPMEEIREAATAAATTPGTGMAQATSEPLEDGVVRDGPGVDSNGGAEAHLATATFALG